MISERRLAPTPPVPEWDREGRREVCTRGQGDWPEREAISANVFFARERASCVDAIAVGQSLRTHALSSAALSRTREQLELRRAVKHLTERLERLEQMLHTALTEERNWLEIERRFLQEVGAADLSEAQEKIDEGISQEEFDEYLRSLTPEEWEDMRKGD